jgi:hypothetical protein
LQANLKFQSKKIDKVLKEIRGTEVLVDDKILSTDLGDNEKAVLKEYYNVFLEHFTKIVD